MKSKKSFWASCRWIYEVSNRFARIDRAGRSAVTTFLATLGIAFGVMTLITVLSVMNGFQLTSILPIMELSSYHLRVSDIPEENFVDFIDFCENSRKIKAVVPFYESQSLIVSDSGAQASAIIRGIPENTLDLDKGFAREININRGKFDLSEPDSIILGSKLARSLNVSIGDTVNLMALSGGRDVALISQNRKFKVRGIFQCTYSDINAGYSFICTNDAEKYFGKEVQPTYGIKLSDYEDDIPAVALLKSSFPSIKVVSWREFNRSFFGTLRVEKNILMLLVCIIFVVVGINIYNGMRRLVFERSQDISVLSALGGTKAEIKSIFIMRGFTSGLAGSVAGAILGILISINIKDIFIFFSDMMYFVQYFFTVIFMPDAAEYLSHNGIYEQYAQIPARIVFREVLMIVLFGIIAPLWASWQASNNVLNMSVAEVLHDE